MDLEIDWDDRHYTLDVDSITGKEYAEIERYSGVVPDVFLTGIFKVDFETDEDGNTVFQIGTDGLPVLDREGKPKPKVARTWMPSGGVVNALMWLFLKRDNQKVRLSDVDVPYAKFVVALSEGIMEKVRAEEEIEPESPDPKVSAPTSAPGTTSTDIGVGSPSLSDGS